MHEKAEMCLSIPSVVLTHRSLPSTIVSDAHKYSLLPFSNRPPQKYYACKYYTLRLSYEVTLGCLAHGKWNKCKTSPEGLTA